MSKICPNCQIEYDDSHDFCSNCGSRLIDNIVANDPILNVGDATAISGGININQSKNVTSHDTHYHSTTVHERSKSELEIKLDAANQLREKAEGIMAERGRIDSVAMSQLRPLASQLGIDDETFKSIIKDVRSNRNGGASGLSVANARYLQQAQQAVQTNDMDALSNLTPRLEAMAAISQDDNVQYLYYLTLSLFYPIKSMEVYEQQMDENYWRVFWAIISYVRSGKHAEATSLLAQFDPLRFEKSEDDQNLLEAYFNIMKSDKDAAQEFLDEILGEPTAQIKPLLRAIESTLYEEEPESLEVRFYVERVMTKSDVVVKSAKSAESKPAAEVAPKKAKPEAKQEPQPIPTPKEAPTSKDNKEANDLYAKASAASGAKRVMLLQKAADAGSLDAMYDLAICYTDEDGVGKNMPLAVKWLQKAADLGHVTALAALGDLYINGAEGVDQNYALSEKYFLKAADYDNLYSQAGLAVLYLLTEEYEKSLLWARKAAQQEEPLALFTLGRIYDEGLGVEVDHIEGLKWLEKAADKGYEGAQNTVGNIYMNADYIKNDPQKAFKYYQMAAAKGHLEGMANLGWCYQEGLGTDVNLLSAEEWLRKAADGGLQDAIDILNNNPLYSSENNETDLAPDPNSIVDEDAEYQKAKLAYDQKDYDTVINICTPLAENNNANALNLLGNCYFYGNGVKQDYKKAVEWYQKAADLGYAVAMRNLGNCYYNGNGVKQDYKKAVEWWQKAADLGDAAAMANLGNCYYDGNGVKRNYKKAVELYQKAADLGEVFGMSGLGLCYHDGNGVKQDYEKALEWYQKSIDNGRVKDEWITTRMEACTQAMQGPSATINNIWFDCNDRNEVYVHVNFAVNGLKGEWIQIRLYVTNKSKNKRYEFSQFAEPIYESTLWEDFCFTINEYDISLPHDKEIEFSFVVEILHKDSVLVTEEKAVVIWSYFNFISKNKLEIRRVK